MDSGGGWVTQTKRKQKPRKKPVLTKRTVVKPDSKAKLTDLEEEVYKFLVKCYPTSVSCEDIMVGVRMDTKVEIENVWKVMDKGVISELVDEPYRKNYVLKTVGEE